MNKWSGFKDRARRARTSAGQGSAVTPGADAAGPARSTRRNHRWLDVVAVAVVAGLVGLALGGWVMFRQYQKDDAAQEALRAAQNYVLKLTNLDSEAVDSSFADILNGSTGEFNDLYRKSSQQFRQELTERQLHTRGSVVAAAVKSATPDKVVVLMFVDESIRSRDSSRSQLDHVCIKMTMVKLNGRWVARKVQLL
ncbi:hypothetical protein [Mycobacterium attenuatum]|uniref:hypothetical protein n=1 Tax=Mycobacterium attenuatum TaxID=2341086 RepID=UPI000F2782E5|nr:hypothetical protein [Mycobacterium attenuatum]VBA59943.1 hypothetical protein LAUMK41_03743 [Mycobacterium attenuatum]